MPKISNVKNCDDSKLITNGLTENH